ncbi:MULTISPECIES: MFS transporter [Kitasatospora]|uniref:Putative major facilitator superfamily transporter n=1 Tax=Kitasatospora setae (strain ATCC 33774 / DSM 43861 / JCM 3304 / KCC A-0304 / NBRC 14216 / KM-6054) TaxID=452652 RepID=E4NFP9_KITSK|nr:MULTISPECIES: MFS transporter [Kitasatospora]BAJ30329.1 putative major facilitator superfamily transporter [Kitasatospora setae KM-6054]
MRGSPGDRRPLLLGSALVGMLAFATVPAAQALGAMTAAQLYAVAFANGCATVVFSVAQQAALPVLVAPGQLGAATGQAESAERTAAILGPPAAAVLFHRVWPAAPFLVDALSFAVIAVLLGRIRTHLGPDAPSGVPSDEPPRGGLLAGARSLLRDPLLRDLTLLNSAGDLLFAGVGLLMIVLLRGGGQQGAGIGLVFSVAAAGGLAGSLVANRLEDRLGMAAAVIGKHVLTALLFPVLLLGLPPLGVGLLWGAISFQVSVVGVIQRKHVLLATSAELMGRVQSFTAFLSFGSLPVGAALTGLALDLAGPRGTVAGYTAALALLAAASIASRAIRTTRPPGLIRP